MVNGDMSSDINRFVYPGSSSVYAGTSQPNFIDPVNIERPSHEFINRDDFLVSQVREAELHQFRVDSGLCWQEDYPSSQMLESSTIGFGSLPEELRGRVCWTAAQKATFFELVGRKTALALPEIAAKIGKSLLECQTYLDFLNSEGEHRAIDYCEIPAAEEIPVSIFEPDLGHVDISSGTGTKKISEKNEKEAGLFVLSRLKACTGKPVSPSAIHALHSEIRQKLVDWITAISRRTMSGPGVSVSVETVLEVVGDDNGPSVGYKESRGNSSDDEPDFHLHDDSESEALSEIDTKQYELIQRESDWLEKFDSFELQSKLQAYGYHGLSKQDLVPPPEPRDSDLEKFMQSR